MLQVFFRLTFVRGIGILYLNLTLKIRFEMKDTHKQIDTGPPGLRCALPYLLSDTAFLRP